MVIVSDQVLVNGDQASLTLTTDGILRWFNGGVIHGCLCIEKEVIGLSTVGHVITIKALVSDQNEFCYGNGKTGKLVRKSFVFQPVSDYSLRNLCDKIQGYIDSLGKFILFTNLLLF